MCTVRVPTGRLTWRLFKERDTIVNSFQPQRTPPETQPTLSTQSIMQTAQTTSGHPSTREGPALQRQCDRPPRPAGTCKELACVMLLLSAQHLPHLQREAESDFGYG